VTAATSRPRTTRSSFRRRDVEHPEERLHGIAAIEAPDTSTVVFKLSSRRLPPEQPWPRRGTSSIPRIPGQGSELLQTKRPWLWPFKFKSHTRGSAFEVSGIRLLREGPAYLAGYSSSSARKRPCAPPPSGSGRAYIEFRDLPNAVVEAIRSSSRQGFRPDDAMVEVGIAINNT